MTDQKSSKKPKWLYIAAGLFALVSVVALVNGVLAVDNSPTTSSPEFAKSVLFFIFSVISLLLSIVIFFVAKAGPAFVTKENATRLYENQMTDQKSSKQPKWLFYVLSIMCALAGFVGLVKGISSPEAGLLIPSIVLLVLSIVIFFMAKTGSAFVTKEDSDIHKNRDSSYQCLGPRKLAPVHRNPRISRQISSKLHEDKHKVKTFELILPVLLYIFILAAIFSHLIVEKINPNIDPESYSFWYGARELSLMGVMAVIACASASYWTDVIRGKNT